MFNLLRKCDWSTRRRRVRRRACAGCSASVSRRCASGWTSATPASSGGRRRRAAPAGRCRRATPAPARATPTTDRTTAPTGRTSTTDCAGGSLHNHRTRLFPNGWVTTPQDRVGVGVTTPARRNPARRRRAGKSAVPDWWVTTPQDRVGVGVTTQKEPADVSKKEKLKKLNSRL